MRLPLVRRHTPRVPGPGRQRAALPGVAPTVDAPIAPGRIVPVRIVPVHIAPVRSGMPEASSDPADISRAGQMQVEDLPRGVRTAAKINYPQERG